MTAKKSPSVKTTTKKKATAKKAAAKKATAKKAAAKKAIVPKASAKKAIVPKASAKKATAKKATAKKATAKKAVVPKAKSRKTAAAPKKKTAAAAPKKKAASRTASVPAARRSGRATAVVEHRPLERALTDEEREAMAKCAQTALSALDVDGIPEVIVSRIGAFVDEIRTGHRPEPSSQDIRLGLGVLWGEQVRVQVGWRWVHLSYPNGFASYALVPDDRAFACFPLNRLTDLMRSGADAMNTSVPLFDSIRIGALPARRENAYLVIG